MISRRGTVIPIVICLFLLMLTILQWPPDTWSPAGQGYDSAGPASKNTDFTSASPSNTQSTKVGDSSNTQPPISPAALRYFDQAYSVDKPVAHELLALQQSCQQTQWSQDETYLDCGYIQAGLTTIISSLKVCFKMAIEAGIGLVLPSMPLRDSVDLTDFNLMNSEAYLSYDKLFDIDHFILQMHQYCPQMRLVRPEALDVNVPVKHRWFIDIKYAPQYIQYNGVFWPGRPFKAFFDQQYAGSKFLASTAGEQEKNNEKGATIVRIDSEFLIYRIMDDPTGHDLRLWNDLAHLIRFREDVRKITAQTLELIKRPFYGVHFRVESDTIWSPLEEQLPRDLDALDRAWSKYGNPSDQKPLVYLACGDKEQVERFVSAGAERGWEVTHKWHLARDHADILDSINALEFDMQGAVDMGVMTKSDFFLGITGSAFSSTIANVRDATGRYRGSSFLVKDDYGARSHLFNDNESRFYPCCL